MSNNKQPPKAPVLDFASKENGMVATAKLTKETYNALVYTSILGQSIYLSKQLFGGNKPQKLVISLEWQQEDLVPQEVA